MSIILSATATLSFTQLIADDMREVDALIAARLSSQVVLIRQVGQYIIAAGGKRMRPTVLLLMAHALGVGDNPQRINLAAVLEFIHTATLLHDDVVDESQLRRGQATANHAFGNPASVLVGDFLYSRAFQMMVESGQMRVMEILAHTTNTIAEGEVMQLMNIRDASLTQESYLQVIRSKTAKLFEASGQLAAVLAKSCVSVERACAQYGLSMGTAFQIVDDILDYAGDSAAIGKNVGDDLREGKVTLPIIFALQKASASEREMIVQAIETGSLENLSEITAAVKSSGALERAHTVAQEHADLAQQAIGELPSNVYTQALLELAQQAVLRHA